DFRVFALTGGKNLRRLKNQILRYRPEIVAVGNSTLARKLKDKLPSGIKILEGIEGLVEIAGHSEVEIVVNGLVGSMGIFPTLEAIRCKKRVALANKETIVAFGEVVMEEVERSGAELIPVDSEPSAIFQCLSARHEYGQKEKAPSRIPNHVEIKRILLTASGGPFLKRKSLKNVTIQEALRHPTWKMGKKITIDSATLMNKGFEVIEALWFFHLSPSQIQILIHPHSIVHSLVEFQDGSLLAQMGVPDMRLPIQYALTYPQRLNSLVRPLDLAKVKELKFYPPDFKKFPCLQLAYNALKKGGTLPAVLSAADEVVVDGFLLGKIPFVEIPSILKNVMKNHNPPKADHPSLEEILQADKWAREEAGRIVAVAGGSSSGRLRSKAPAFT
ncbi:1-deoxy-D-xylulose-5-phosphate reductoisomerase, partial [candidate division TA06 bacterium]|nr:1-deoxy-D-xylulose-5-phosphate reductoisomerase [candidate division TA06 bacterium]